MKYHGFRKTNHLAIAGFLMPFAAAAIASVYVLNAKGDFVSFRFRFCFVVLIPLVLGLGLFFSVKSIPQIRDRNDKDYAYSGLVLNLFFIALYLVSAFYILFSPNT
ncbi:MAG: hypothetical protein DRH11_08285 [Deltaproteobacteria bacterium]|nr:MAG: hypothetical protein DRG63_09740 [Deltaproteobacteria bacterium]RLB33683.1 MAG: hypothetical protein DRH11_08285 [Deltaproteobacteria bacterium]